MARVLIVGCGYVGTALGQLLSSKGDLVWGLRRDTASLPSCMRPCRADLTVPETLSNIPSDLDDVVYAVSADSFDSQSYRQAYIDGFENLLSVVQTTEGRRPKRLIYVSSTSVYGQVAGEVVNEDSSTSPSRFSGQVMLEGERLGIGCSIPTVVVRFGGIYGPGRTRLIEKVLGGATCSANPVRFTNRIHRDDCAGVLAHLLRLVSPESVYLAVDDKPAPECEVMRWLADQLCVPLTEGSDLAMSQTGPNKRCFNGRLRASGYRFIYPTYQDGYQAVLAGLTP